MSKNILEEAAEIIDGARNETYGDATEEFAGMAKAWSAYLGIEITDLDYANMMIILKVFRARKGWHRDNYVDTCGYARLAERCHDKHEADKKPASGGLIDASKLPVLPSIPHPPYGFGGVLAGANPIGTINSGLINTKTKVWSLSAAETDRKWISTLSGLVYWFEDGQWWIARSTQLEDPAIEDPWVKSMYKLEVPKGVGPFEVYTGPGI